MWGFLRNFLKGEETAKVSNLAEFVEEKSKGRLDELKLKLRSQNEKIEETVKKTRDDVEKLEKAELMNKGISVKEMQIMQGNRDSYVRFVKTFLEKIGNAISLEQHSALFDQFNKSTAKSYYVLQHFFSYEAREIALDIKKLDSMVKELNETRRQEAEINALKQEMAQLEHIKELKQEKQDKLKKLHEDKKEEEEKIKEVNSRIWKIKDGAEYREYVNLETEKNDAEKELEALKGELFHYFSVIEKAMKKMQKIVLDHKIIETSEIAIRNLHASARSKKAVSECSRTRPGLYSPAVLDNYLTSPISALLKDEDFKILEIVEKTRKAILSNSIWLKDRKREKTIEALNVLNKNYFENYVKKYNELNKKIRALKEKIKDNKTIKEIGEIEMRISENEDRLNNICRSIKELENKDFDTERIKHEILARIKEVFNMKVELEMSEIFH